MTLQAPNLNGQQKNKYAVTTTFKDQSSIRTEHWTEVEHIEFWRFLSLCACINGFAITITVEQLV